MPKLIITLGLHLDGQRAINPSNCLGEIAVGPLGLLTILETQLGLLAVHPSHAERIVQYRSSLALADTQRRFYHASFATDALGTAATLLGWRDLCYLHGWGGAFSEETNVRLADLAAVEVFAQRQLAPSVGERFARVLVALTQRSPAIDSLRLVDPMAAFPKPLQGILARLPCVLADANLAHGERFLGELQSTLLAAANGQKPEKLLWQDDGSVVVVQAETRLLAGTWLASQIDSSQETMVLASADRTRLDANLAGAGQPRLGLKESSTFRPALQLLPLALEILWAPLNFHALVQFLTHPVCPVPSFARRRLAAKIADQPGIGGTSWARAIEDIDMHYEQMDAPAVRQKIRQWVEHPRFPQNLGAPVAVVLERVEQLTQFFRSRLGDDDVARRASNAAGYSQCSACVESLKGLQAQGVDLIRPRQLQKLVTQATGNGVEHPGSVAEVGAALAITHPGAAVAPVDRVIWWHLVMPVLPSAHPFSSAEMASLATAGVTLPSSEERQAQAAREWLRPVLAARKQLTLILPPPGEEVHPVWQMLEAVVGKPVVRSLEDVLITATTSTRPTVHTRLAAPKRWWQVPQDIDVPLRPKESFSSLELMLFNPYHWLLKYPAALRPSRIISISGEFRMRGALAHGLVELLYQHADALTMSDALFAVWFDSSFAQIVSEEGALLLMDGRGADLEEFRYRLQKAMQTLRQQVDLAEVVSVVPEMALTGSFAGGELSGYADLVMRKADGMHIITDMKWSGAKKFPVKLKGNRHLQLAIYAELLRQELGAWPAVSYYILDQARFFAPDANAFPGADVVPADSGENGIELYQRFIATWKWRKEQIAAGWFEVALASIDATDDSSAPDAAMTTEYLNEAYNDYSALAGWEY